MTQFGISHIIFYPKLRRQHFFQTYLRICWCPLCQSSTPGSPCWVAVSSGSCTRVPELGHDLCLSFKVFSRLPMGTSFFSKNTDPLWVADPIRRMWLYVLTSRRGCHCPPHHLTFNLSAKNHQLMLSFLDTVHHLKRVLTALWLLPIFNLSWIL